MDPKVDEKGFESNCKNSKHEGLEKLLRNLFIAPSLRNYAIMRCVNTSCTFTCTHLSLTLVREIFLICATFDSSRGERFQEILKMEYRLNQMEIKDILIF